MSIERPCILEGRAHIDSKSNIDPIHGDLWPNPALRLPGLAKDNAIHHTERYKTFFLVSCCRS